MQCVLFSLCLFLALSSFAQSNKNYGGTGQSFYAEVGGPGILFSANYDRRFTKTPFGIGGRVGLGFLTSYESISYTDMYGYTYFRDRNRSVLTVPVQVNYLFGKPSSASAFEVGLGATFAGKSVDLFNNYYDAGTKNGSVFGTASFMYRRMPKDGGFSWRVGFTPIFADGYIEPSAAAGVGYNF